MNYTKGTKVQRKGSKVVWTINSTDEFSYGFNWKGLKRVKDAPERVHLSCIPKNRTTEMSEWVSIENFNKNWVEV